MKAGLQLASGGEGILGTTGGLGRGANLGGFMKWGYPQLSIRGCSIINQPFWGTRVFWNPPYTVYIYIYIYIYI